MAKLNSLLRLFAAILLSSLPATTAIARIVPGPENKSTETQAQKKRLKSGREKNIDPLDLQLLEENLFLSLAGPIQHETFGQSSQTGEQKYDPNLISYGVLIRWRRNFGITSFGPVLLLRGFRAYDNTSHLQPEGSSEGFDENTKVSAIGAGSGYVVSTQLLKTESWFPYLGLFFEYNQASVERAVEANSFQEAENASVTSRKVFSYLQLGSAWTITFPSLTLNLELNLTIPARSWQLRTNNTAAQENLLNRLQHKQAPGIGTSVGVAQWL